MRLRELLIAMSLAISLIPVGIIGGFQGLESATAFTGLIFVVTFFVSAVISYFITRPLEQLTANIDEISKGNLEVNIDSSEIYEINKLAASLNRVLTSLKLAIHKVGVKKGEIFEETIKAKERAENELKCLLRDLNIWILELNEKGICTACSHKTGKYLGYSPSEIIGKNIEAFISPEQVKQLRSILSDLAKGKTVQSQNQMFYWKHKNGNTICSKTILQPVLDEGEMFQGIRSIFLDCTELASAELKIQELNKQITLLKDQMKSLITKDFKSVNKNNLQSILLDKETQIEFDHTFIFDEQTNIIEADDKLYQMLGYTREEFLNLKLSDLEFLESPEKLKKMLSLVKNGEDIIQKSIHRRKDGGSIFVTEKLQYLKDQQKFRCNVIEEFTIDTAK